MIYNFSEIAEKNSLVEEELLLLKKEYKKQEMSNEQFEKLRLKMKEAKLMDKKERNKARMKKAAVIAAAFVAAIIILPNTSVTIAHAMEQIPIIGQLVKVVTFRDYQYETDRNMADIEVPEIKVEGAAGDSGVQDKLERTTEEINAEIKEITDELIKDFEANLQGGNELSGYCRKKRGAGNDTGLFYIKAHLLSGSRKRISVELLLHY